MNLKKNSNLGSLNKSVKTGSYIPSSLTSNGLDDQLTDSNDENIEKLSDKV